MQWNYIINGFLHKDDWVSCIAIDKYSTKWIGVTNISIGKDLSVVKFDGTCWTFYNESKL